MGTRRNVYARATAPGLATGMQHHACGLPVAANNMQGLVCQSCVSACTALCSQGLGINVPVGS